MLEHLVNEVLRRMDGIADLPVETIVLFWPTALKSAILEGAVFLLLAAIALFALLRLYVFYIKLPDKAVYTYRAGLNFREKDGKDQWALFVYLVGLLLLFLLCASLYLAMSTLMNPELRAIDNLVEMLSP